MPERKRWSEKDLAELGDFVRLLYHFGSFRTWEEFAEASKVHAVSMSRWKNGGMMEGPNLLKLVRGSGALALIQQGVIVPERSPLTKEGIDLRLRELEEAVGEIESGKTVAALLEELADSVAIALERLRRLEERAEPGGAAPTVGTP